MQRFNSNSDLKKYRSEVKEKSFCVIKGGIIHEALLNFGADPGCLRKLKNGEIHEQVPIDLDPSQSYRQVCFHRMVKRGSTVQPGTNALMRNNYYWDEEWHFNNSSSFTQISETEIGDSKLDNVVRSGTRRWSKAPEIYQTSTLPMAIAKLNNFFLPQKHQKQDNIDYRSPIIIADQVCIKISKTILGGVDQQPTPEGIHQDNTEISSVMMIGKENIKSGGITRLWSLDTPTGYYSDEEFEEIKKQGTLLSEFTLENAFDTVIFNDRKLKHEVRSFNSKLKNQPCSRSVLVNFIRKPLNDGTDNFSIYRDFYKKRFNQFDTNCDSYIDLEEFKGLLKFLFELGKPPMNSMNLCDDKAYQMFLNADLDGNGMIDFEEFIFMMENIV